MSWIERLESGGQAPALITPSDRISFASLARAARVRQRELEERGVGAEQAVLISLPNSAALVIELLALLELGAVPVLVPRGLGAAAVRVGGRASAAGWIRDPRGLRRAGAGSGGRLEGIALVKISSGSTGAPKAIALSSSQLACDGAQVRRGLRLGPSDRILMTLPLLHSYGFDFGFLQLLRGSALVLAPPLPRAIGAALAAGATVFPTIPFVLDLLTRHARGLRGPKLRAVISAAAPLEPAVAARAAAALGRPIRPHYGSSEAGALTLGRRQRWAGDVGTALPGVRLRLRCGRVEASGRQVALGYLVGGRLTRRFGGRFLAHDRGRLDRSGLTLLGRADRVRVLPTGNKQALLARTRG